MTTFAVTGATGQLGRLVIEQLKARVPAENIIALVRSPEKAADLGVTVRRGDYKDTTSLDSALQGVDKLLLISSNDLGNRVADHKNVIDAAKKAGVKQIVYTSLLRADSSPLSVAKEHPATEADLKNSGLVYTILRNGWYTENYTGSIPVALANGAFYGSAGEGKISSAARADYAQAAVEVLLGEGHDNQTYELVGDTAYTLTELAAELSKQSDKTIPYVDIPEADYAAALAKAGVPADFAAIIAGWDTDAKNGALYAEDRTLSRLIGRPTTDLATVIKAAL
ncbi:SDR family oxidoreductase [Rodentibacter haemolyticus]|uniref:SDR family oxidoreductase n=1 Tax=Rodentibacter haemolyticus TaxID=2778911 RepID=A0ABX6UW17_9PAST|nr:SDR family oxidoreductase [Rodentibacter haemolyticus]QPB42088.1 SDR family oxidoreductase [Rodentibacter haemolyticus]